MRWIPFVSTIFLTVLVLWFLGTPQEFGATRLPPMGNFLNPFSGFWRNAEPANTRAMFKEVPPIEIKGLQGPVEVLYDDNMVPHIFAENKEDAYRVQGYVTAQHRLWQMDLVSRQVAGRLSEVLGARTLPLDRLIRRRGLSRAAEIDWEAWQQSDATRRALEAYAEGVNAWIDQMHPADYPIEFKLLDYAPEHWTPLKTAMIIENMIDALNGRDNDLASTNALALLGRDTFDYLFPQWFDRQIPVVPDTGQWKQMQPRSNAVQDGSISAVHQQQVPDRNLPVSWQDLSGSNNWAVDGRLSKSGAPLLANDMHLPLKLPHVWYQLQIHTPEHSSYGVIVPGVPSIVVGFNHETAWGFTNVSQEVADWYKVDWVDAGRSYRLDDSVYSAELRIETIKVRGSKPVVDTVPWTVWGPVVHHNQNHPLAGYAYRYTTHDAPQKEDLARFFRINEICCYEEYREAIPGLDCLSQNVAFISRGGDVAITVQGRFPIRRPEQGRFLQDGAHSENAWLGFVPVEHLPAMKNPSRGFIFSANQHSTGPGYPYYYLGRFDSSRGRRIFQRLSAMEQVTIDSMKSIQLDNYSSEAADALPALLRQLDRSRLNQEQTGYLKTLENWDYRFEAGSMAPSLYRMWFDSAYIQTWDELDALRENKSEMLYPEAWRFVQILDSDPGSLFFDHPSTPARETAKDIVTEAFVAAIGKAKDYPEGGLEWQRFKNFKVSHLARLDGFSRLDVLTGGDGSAPNATKSEHGPSWRMIVELTEPVRAQGIYPGGQSGNPGSPFYDNMIDSWATGGYLDLLLLDGPDATERILGRRTFIPAGGQ